MSKLLSSIVFTFLLLFQTTATAEEGSTPIEASVEEMEVQEQVEPQDTLSEAQKEALAAEEAELREAGVREEPIVE